MKRKQFHKPHGGRFSKARRIIGTVARGAARAGKAVWKNRNRIKAGWRVAQAFRKPVGGSRTATATAKAEKTITGDDVHSGVSHAYMKFKVFPSAVSKVLKGSMIDYYYTDSFKVVSVSGVQAEADLFQLSTVSQWLTSTALPPTASQSNVRWFDMNPAQKLTGSVFISGSIPANDKLCLFSSETYLEFVNSQTIAASCRLFAFKCVRDTDVSPNTLWSTFLTAEAMGVGGSAIPAAGVATGTAAGTLSSGMPYSSPNDYPDFKKVWKLVAMKDFDLAAAATRKVLIHIQHNDIADQKIISQTSGHTQYRKGSVAFFYTAVGQAVFDHTVALGTTIATWGATQVGIVQRTKLRFKAVKAGPNRLQGHYSQYGTPAQATAANQQTIDIVDAVAGILQAG